MPTQLRYDLTTDPFPLQASPASGGPVTAKLTVVGSNPTPSQPVTLQGLSLTVPVGADANSLTSTQPADPVPPDGWKLQAVEPGTGSVEYVFYPQAGQGQVGGQGLAFTFNAVVVNTEPGTCLVSVKEGSAGNPRAQLQVTKFPPSWGTVAFWAAPANVKPGEAATLYWVGPPGATYTVEFYTPRTGVVNVPGPGEPPLGNQGQYPPQQGAPLQLTQTTVFTLTVRATFDGQPYFAQRQVTVAAEVGAPLIKSFASSPAVFDPSSDATLRLVWQTENTAQLHIDGVGTFSGANALDGGQAIAPPTPCAYFATAYGQQGYSGPPAAAQTIVGFGGSATSGFLMMWVKSLQPSPLWTLSLGPGRDLLSVASQVDSLNDDTGHIQNYTGTVQLAPKLEAAFLGTGGGGTSYDALVKAHYQPATTLAPVWYGYRYNLSDDIFGESSENDGYTWGVKLPDRRLVLVWYAGAAPDSTYYGIHSWAFSFQWIDYGYPLGSAPAAAGE
jgi:hypothetical protein